MKIFHLIFINQKSAEYILEISMRLTFFLHPQGFGLRIVILLISYPLD